MNILITICARGGSKGIPGKNIRPLNGKPLIAYSIETAFQFSKHVNADVALSTDDIDIKNAAEKSGLTTSYTRPASMATDGAGKAEVIRDILEYEEKSRGMQYDYVLDLDVTSPLRNLEDLKKGFEIIKNDDEALNLFSVNPAARNPYFNMVEEKESGYYELVKEGAFLTRQSAPKVFDLNASFYFYRRKYFDQENLKTINSRSLIYVMPHICFDLDHPIDFEFLEFLLANNKLDFSL